MNKEIEIKLVNGSSIFIYNDEWTVLVELVNNNGYAVSDIKLTQDELERINLIVNSK
ncbi:hypothetical protein [Psychrobacillus phage Perkons]|nr:hypothetical protein [Psychrobacillus phage Perkons]